MKRATINLTGKRQNGFTLVEAVLTIVITGIVASMAAVFMRIPVQGYFDSASRAELTDAADTALRRMERDIRLALPNSIRVAVTPTGNYYVEFLLTSTGGRYLDQADNPAGNFLDFDNAADTTFDNIGPPLTITPGSDQVVIFNLGPGNPNNDAYIGLNRAMVTAVAGNTITLANNPFATNNVLTSSDRRFQVVTTPVTYGCVGGLLTRYWGYAISAAQNTPPANAQSAVLAGGVTQCIFSYFTPAQLNSQLMGLSLTLMKNGESVALFHQIHVVNTP